LSARLVKVSHQIGSSQLAEGAEPLHRREVDMDPAQDSALCNRIAELVRAREAEILCAETDEDRDRMILSGRVVLARKIVALVREYGARPSPQEKAMARTPKTDHR